MKPRKWVLGLCLAVLLAALGLYEGVRRLEKSRNIERVLIDRVSVALGGSFGVARVRFGFFSVRLEGVSLSLPLSAVTIDIKDIRAGFSFVRLVRSRGDFAASISRIILVEPELSVRLGAAADSSAAPPFDSGAAVAPAFSIRDFPVDYLMIKNGTVRLLQADGSIAGFGRFLDGRLWETDRVLQYELQGRIGSFTRNLSVAGQVPLAGGPARFSVRLDRARLAGEIRLAAGTVTGGVIDGVCEFIIPASLRLSELEAQGRIRIEKATGTLSGVRQPVERLDLTLLMDGPVWRVDSASAVWNGVAVQANGAWRLDGKDTDRFTARLAGISPSRLAPQIRDEMAGIVDGDGFAEVSVERVPGGPGPVARVRAGGLSLFGRPLLACGARMSALGRLAIVDSLIVRTADGTVRARGSFALDSTFPAYEMEFDAVLDTLPGAGGVGGRFMVKGSTVGREGMPRTEAAVTCDELRIGGMPFGPAGAVIRHRDRRLSVNGSAGGAQGGIAFDLALDSLFSGRQTVSGSMIAAPQACARLAALALSDSTAIGDCSVRLEVTGVIDAWTATGALSIDNPGVSGVLDLQARRMEDGRVAWVVDRRSLTVGGADFPLSARGSWHPDSFVVDSLLALGGAALSGKIGTGKVPSLRVNADVRRVSLAALDKWFLGGKVRVDSGTVSGYVRAAGAPKRVTTSCALHVRRMAFGSFNGLETDALVQSRGDTVTVLPLVIRKGGTVVLSVDTLRAAGGRFSASGDFEDVDLVALFGQLLPEELKAACLISGSFRSADGGFPVAVSVRCDTLMFDTWQIDSVQAAARVTRGGIVLDRVSARDGPRSRLGGSAVVPWSFLGPEVPPGDTLKAALAVEGDLLATLGKNYDSPIGGSGRGTIELSLVATEGEVRFDKAVARIPDGILTVRPFVPGPVNGFSFTMTMDDSSRVHTVMSGVIGKRRMRVRSVHDLPGGFEPLQFGPLDFGALLVETPDRDVELHLPGFQEIGDIVDVEFAPKAPFSAFAVSGPINRLKITGTWIVRNADFTYPFLDTKECPWPFDPFPFVTWDLDLKVGNRKVMYFWDLAGKRRKIVRFVEGYLDPISRITVLGRDLDRTFRITGSLLSYKGSAYFGKVFDRRFEVGVDFVPQPLPGGKGYDNLPVIWGSAETFSDSSRFDRTKLTLQLIDPATGGMSERGRIALMPVAAERRGADGGPGGRDSIVNFNLHLSSDLEQVAGESEREFYQETGLRFTTFSGAGEFVSDFGEQYLHRYLLERFEKRLAKRLGLDVISIETSIASNYFTRFYNRQLSDLMQQWDLLALANVGITVGRYFFNDYLFLKARGELVPLEEESLTPEYSLGFEFQPVQYFLMDFNYGILRNQSVVEHNPRLNLQLRVPITGLRNLMKF